jgi:hypothetical protein
MSYIAISRPTWTAQWVHVLKEMRVTVKTNMLKMSGAMFLCHYMLVNKERIVISSDQTWAGRNDQPERGKKGKIICHFL